MAELQISPRSTAPPRPRPVVRRCSGHSSLISSLTFFPFVFVWLTFTPLVYCLVIRWCRVCLNPSVYLLHCTSYPVPPTLYLLPCTSYSVPPTLYLLFCTFYRVPPYIVPPARHSFRPLRRCTTCSTWVGISAELCMLHHLQYMGWHQPQ